MSAPGSHFHPDSSDSAESMQEDVQLIRNENQQLHYPSYYTTHNAHQGTPWVIIQSQQIEEANIPLTSPSFHIDLSEGDFDEVINLNSNITSSINPSMNRIGDVDAPQSPLSVAGDSNGSPSIGSRESQGSPDSMSPSDCENQPLSPCNSPCYSRPGSPWPMFARPSFKKTRSPFWTTFRVREFR